VDYSHGIRFIENTLTLDGKPSTVAAVLADPVLCELLSDEGPLPPLTAAPSPGEQLIELPLPDGVREPFTVYLNGVRQELGRDYSISDRRLVFEKELVKEGNLGFWRWFLGAWGIGTYKRNDQVDVAWDVNGQPRVAHALDIEQSAPKSGS
jgi:hypothetical protein